MGKTTAMTNNVPKMRACVSNECTSVLKHWKEELCCFFLFSCNESYNFDVILLQ